jgi:hypothetical protein
MVHHQSTTVRHLIASRTTPTINIVHENIDSMKAMNRAVVYQSSFSNQYSSPKASPMNATWSISSEMDRVALQKRQTCRFESKIILWKHEKQFEHSKAGLQQDGAVIDAMLKSTCFIFANATFW